jgi:hypothetical protein
MAVKKTIIIDAQTDSAEKSIDGLKKSTDNLSESTSDLTGSLDKLTGGAISGFKGVSQSVKKAVTGFKNLRVAIIATGIGALVLGVLSLQKAFTASEEGQNRFAKLMTQIGVVTGNVVDILANLGESIFAAGKALLKLAKGDLKGASAAWGELKTNISEVVDGVKNFGEETKNEIKLAGQLADARAKADKAERKLILDRAEANRQIAELREIAADKENVSVQERLDALREAGRVNDEIAQKEIETARIRFEAKKLENSLSKSTKEDLDEQARLQAELINLETARLNTQKRLTAEITGAIREEQAEKNAIQKEQDALEKERKATLDKEESEKQAKLEADKKARDERIVASEIDVENRRIAAKKKVVDQAIALFGAETAAGKAALIAKQLLNAQELIAEARKTITFSSLVAARSAVAEGTAQTAKIGFPQNIPMLIGYALQAVGIIGAITQAVGKSKSVAGGLGGGSAPSITPTAPRAQSQSVPPAFNIVGASDTNQLAEAIGGQAQQPVKAFVVSNDVTTAQELDRNIVKGASLG